MNEKDELELIIKLTAQGAGQAEIIRQLEQIERAAKTASAAVQAAASQPGLTTNKGQFTNMFSANALNPSAQMTAQKLAADRQGMFSGPGWDTAATANKAGATSNDTYETSIQAVNKALGQEIQLTDEQIAAIKRQGVENEEAWGRNRNIAKEMEDGVKSQGRSAKEEAQWQRDRTAALKPFNQEYSAALRNVNEMRKLQFAGRALTEVSQTFFIPSVAVLTGAAVWAQNYVKNATVATDTTIRWKSSMDSLASSQAKVGSTLADIGLPMLEKLAALANNVADFMQANPEVVSAGLKLVTVVAGLSGLGMLAAKGIRLYADVEFMMATGRLMVAETALEAATAALDGAMATNTGATILNTQALLAKAGIETVAPVAETATVAATVGGAEVAGGLGATGAAAAIFGVTNPIVSGIALLAAIVIEFQHIDEIIPDTINVLVALGSGIAGTFAGIFETLSKGGNILDNISNKTGTFVMTLGQLAGVINAPKSQAEKFSDFATAHLPEYTAYQKQISDLTTSYAKQRVDIEATYEKQRTSTVEEYSKAMADATATYNDANAKAMSSYQQSEADAQASYYDSRMKAARDNSQKLLQMEQDHQLEMKRLLEDHNDIQKTNLEKLDGLAMIREDEKYEKERRRDEEDYNIKVSRENAQAGQTMRDNEANFARERAQRAAQFRQTLADNAANYKKSQEQAKAQEDQKLKEAQDNYDSQLATIQAAYYDQLKTYADSFRDRINAIDASILGDQAAVETASMKAHAGFIAWLQANSYTPHLAGGGYAGFGQYTMGEEGTEFVLNNSSTRMAEQAIGGRLTQNNILAAMMSGRSGGYSDQRTLQFNGMTEADRANIRRDIYAVTKEVFAETFA